MSTRLVVEIRLSLTTDCAPQLINLPVTTDRHECNWALAPRIRSAQNVQQLDCAIQRHIPDALKTTYATNWNSLASRGFLRPNQRCKRSHFRITNQVRLIKIIRNPPNRCLLQIFYFVAPHRTTARHFCIIRRIDIKHRVFTWTLTNKALTRLDIGQSQA